MIYHASFTDTETLDLLEQHKMEHFIAPGLAWLINTCHHASEWGLTPEVTKKMGYHRELEAAVETMKALRKRGVRILPGGDYGFAWTPHGTNAKDLEYFVKVVGMSTMEALLSATAWGGPMMKMGKSIGYVREGCYADLLLVDGDPLADITILQDKSRILSVMKGGEFHRAPPRALGADDALGRLRRTPWTRAPSSPTSASSTAPARCPTPAACWCRATASAPSAARAPRSRRTARP